MSARPRAPRAAALAVLLLSVPVLLAGLLSVPLSGWSAHVVTSGSMAPRISAGDVVLVGPAPAGSDLRGRIALFADPARPSRDVVHRVVGGDAGSGFTTRGDANPLPDALPVPAGAVEGVVRVRVPAVGLPALWAHEGRYAALVALAALLTAVTAAVDPARRRLAGHGPGAGARRVRPLLLAAVLPVATVAGGGTVWHATAAALSPATTNPGNTFASAGVSLGTAPGSALWSPGAVPALQPASTGQRCVTVTYTGTAAAAVRLLPAGSAATGDPYVRLSVEEGTAATGADCAGFGGTVTPLFGAGTVAGFRSAAAGGLGTWDPAAAGEFRAYRITWTVLADDAAAGTWTDLGFRWRVSST